jgi:peptide deformylase
MIIIYVSLGAAMAIKQIITAENPLLRQKSKKVTRFGDSLRNLVEDMFDTLRAVNGLGLAAPQIGVLQRVFIVELPPEYGDEGNEVAPEERYVLVNPEIVKMRGEEEMEEGCLSIPGYRGLVKRATSVTIKGQDLNGRPVRYRGEDLLAQAFQHENDHLDGVLYIDRLESPDKLWRISVGDEEGEVEEVASAE